MEGSCHPLEFRLASTSDLVSIAEIEREVFSDPWPLSGFADILGSPTEEIIVLMWNGEIVGYCVIRMVIDESELLNFAIKTGAQGKALGRALLDFGIKMARQKGAKSMYLDVRESNTRAIGLYERRGFVGVGRRSRYYDRPVEDAIVMALRDMNSDGI